MLDKLKVTLKSTLIYSIGNISLKLIGLILLPVYTGHLPLEAYGRWGLLEITSQILVIIIGLRLSTAMIRFYSSEKDTEKKKEILFLSLVITLVSVVLFLFVLYPLAGTASRIYFEDESFKMYFKLLFIWSSMEVLNRLSLDFVRIIQKPILYVIAVSIRFISVLGLNIYFIVGRDMGIEGIILGQTIGSFLLLLITLPILISRMKFSRDLQLSGQLFKYGFPLIFSSLSIYLLTVGDRFLIKILLDYESVGIYSLSYKISSFIKLVLIQAFQLGFIPIVFNMFDKTDFRRFVSKSFIYYTVILVFASLALSIFSKDVIYAFSENPDYYDAYRYIPFMLLAFCFQALQSVFTIGLHYVKRISNQIWITFGAAAINLSLNWFLIPKMGLNGSVLAANISSLFMALFTYFLAQKYYRIPYEIHKVGIVLLVAVGIYFAGSFIPVEKMGLSIALKISLLFLFPFLLYPFKFYEAVELQVLKKLWKTWRNPADWRKNIARLLKEGMGEDVY